MGRQKEPVKAEPTPELKPEPKIVEKKFEMGDLVVPAFTAEDLYQSVTAKSVELTPKMGEFILAKIKAKERLQVIGITSREKDGKPINLLRFDGDFVHKWAADDFAKVGVAPREETRMDRLNQLSKKEMVSLARAEVVEELVSVMRKACRFVEEEFGGISNLEIAQAYSEFILMKIARDHLSEDFKEMLKDMVVDKATGGMGRDEIEMRGRILDGCGGKLVEPSRATNTVVVKKKDTSDKTEGYIG